MWMMGYNDGGEFDVPDSFNGRKLRPLIPRPLTATSHNISSTSTPCLSGIHGTDLLAFNHHLASVNEQSKRELHTQQVVVSSRWNPTPEQLQILEELYRRGTRTPSTDHIQHITAQLRRYGKIEGKNVFYWFQNHKARERQKRRRQLESASDENLQDIEENIERRESGANKTGYEIEQTKSWAPPTNCSTLAEKTVSIQRSSKAGGLECRADGWIQFDEGELQRTRSMAERNATWQMMQLSCSPTTRLINSTTMPATVRAAMDPQLIKAQDLSIFIRPYTEDLNNLVNVGDERDEAACEEAQTLQLFPLRSDEVNKNESEKETECSIGAISSNLTPCQFFEFLPLKN